MRSFDHLQQAGIIYTRRGLGYFVAEGAGAKIREAQRKEFLEEELPQIREKMQRLGISSEELDRQLLMKPM